MRKQSSIEKSNYNFWHKRTARQYAYRKVMGIYPDEIADIESEYQKISDYAEENAKGLIESIDYVHSEQKHIKFPTIPNNKLIEFIEAKDYFNKHYLK